MKHDTQGRRLLAAMKIPAESIALQLGVNRASVYNWQRGVSLPRKKTRRKILDHYGIPIAAWSYSPTDPIQVQPIEKPKAAAARIDKVALDGVTTIEGVADHIQAIESLMDDPELRPADKLRLLTAKTAALKLKASLEHAAEVTEDRVVRQHPKWAAIRAGLLKVLEGHPDARGAVIELLEGLDV